MMSKGIVRSVYIAYLPQPQDTKPDTLLSLSLPDPSPPPGLITAVATEILYKGLYPAAPLTEATKGNFEVQVRVHVHSHTAWSGSVQVRGSWSTDAVGSLHESVPAGESTFTVVLAAASADVSLWWPAGLGRRPLYNVSARLVSSDGDSVSESAVRRVGFRTLAIVTGNDTDPAWVAANTGADGSADPPLGMFFRINGAAIFARGGNLVPLDELEGRNTAASHRALVRSVAEGGMNILRYVKVCALSAYLKVF
jgi:beta-mannosidase